MIPQLVLASSSPRRRQLLTMLGIAHVVAPSEIDETPRPGEGPEPYALRLAEEKARAASAPDALVLGADTTVVIDESILGKPRDEDEAERMLAQLAGRTHRVVSAVALLHRDRVERAVDVTRVTIRALDAETIRDYVATGEPLDKAGAYAIQGYGAALVERIEGDFFGVMGLPVRLTVELLARFGYRYSFTR
jgi:septum formation protein